MEIEARAPEAFLEEFRLHIHDQLEKSGYVKGPKVSFIETYTKKDTILSLEIKEESDSTDSVFRIESETDIPDLMKIWDNAVISYGNELINKLENIAQDKVFVKNGLKP